MKKEIYVDKYTGKKSVILTCENDEDIKKLHEETEKKLRAKIRARKAREEYMEQYRKFHK